MEQLYARMRVIDSEIKSLEKQLPYTDHGEYGQLKARIGNLHSERSRLWKRTQENQNAKTS